MRMLRLSPDKIRPHHLLATALALPARWAGRLSLRTVWIATVISIVTLVCGLVGGLALWSGQSAVILLAERLQQSAAARVQERLDTYLSTPMLINRLNHEAVGLGELDPQNLDALERHFLAQIEQFPGISAVSYASAGREFVTASRNVLVPGLVVGRSSAASGFALRAFALDAGGRRMLEDHVLDYDPTARPWYQTAVLRGSPAWTPVYRWASGDLGVDAVVPIYGVDRRPLGVLATSLSLSALHDALRQSLASPNATSFIIDRAGRLVASSTGDIQTEGAPPASSIAGPTIAAALAALGPLEGAPRPDESPRTFAFTLAGERQLAQAAPYRDAFGLDWLIITVIPEVDVLGPLAAIGRKTAALIAALLLIATLAAVRMADWVTRPVMQLHQAARALAGGMWAVELDTERDDEIGQLGRSFKQMAEELARSHYAIQASEARYRSLFEGVPIGLYRITPAGELVASNLAARQILSYDQEDTLPQTIAALCASPLHYLHWLSVLEQGHELHNHHLQLRRRDGRLILGRINLRAFRDPAGTLQYYEGSLEDITEQTATERALREHEERLRQQHAEYEVLLHGLSDLGEGVLVWREGRARFANATVCGMSGYADDELQALDLDALIECEAPERSVGTAPAQLDAPGCTAGLLHHKDGRQIPIDIATTILKAGERPTYLTVIRDSSARLRLEQQLRQAQKLESIGRLAGGVAHDFNNLLTAVIGNAELALMELPAESPGYYELREIVQTSGRATALTRQLLAFARKQVIEPRVIDLFQLVSDLERLLSRLLGEDIALSIRSDSANIMIKADPTQIEQVLLNMAVNARDAMPQGGSLSISLRTTWLSVPDMTAADGPKPRAYAHIEVRDTGCGIAAATREHLFEPFFTTKGPDRGTGLGLATSYGIVTQHGGQITVESEVGQGTAFHIYLPLASGAGESAAVVSEESALPRGNETILLAEDEPAVRELVGRFLRWLGYTVLEAADGRSALEIGQAQVPGQLRLLISDVVMPQLGGKELFEALRAQIPNLNILFTSGYSTTGTRYAEQLATREHFLQKPFTPQALARRVRDLLDAR